ncbi:MAG TPA: DUF983 domain-containing protein [Opitutaceae bacterium]|nr:DUF983 domain-containing protein [Opitutaceae bacterium]
MKVSQGEIILRGLTNRCPNCGQRTLFKPGTLFEMNESCANCGLSYKRDEGAFLGSMSLNYGVTLVCYLAPIGFLAYYKKIPTSWAVGLAGVGAILLPALLYRSSQSWWLMNYYFFLPHQLPANKEVIPHKAGDENL